MHPPRAAHIVGHMEEDANLTERRTSAAERIAAKRRQARHESRAFRRRRAAAIAGGMLAAIVVLGVLGRLAWSGGLLLDRLGSGGATVTTAAPQTAPPAPAATARAAPVKAAPSGEATRPGAGDAVASAALPFPDPPALTPETITHARPRRKLVAITLDDGIPFNDKLLDLFEEHDVRATTFILGKFAVARPDLIRRLHESGFEIANHSFDHPFLTRLSDAKVRDQLTRTQKAISKITGNQAPYMRPPFGDTDARIKRIAGAMGYKVVLWNRTFADTSASATPEQLYKNVMDGLAPGDIILCHWGSEDTYQAMRRILPEMKRRGFTPVTLSELLADQQV